MYWIFRYIDRRLTCLRRKPTFNSFSADVGKVDIRGPVLKATKVDVQGSSAVT